MITKGLFCLLEYDSDDYTFFKENRIKAQVQNRELNADVEEQHINTRKE